MTPEEEFHDYGALVDSEDHDDSLGGTQPHYGPEVILVYGFLGILCTSVGICIGALITYYAMR